MNETLTMRYKRGHELVGNVHLFSGTIEWSCDVPKSPTQSKSFIGLKFSQMMSRLSEKLREHPDARVVLQRTDNKGLRPIQLGEDIRVLLRDDPVAAIRSMSPQVGQPVTQSGSDFSQRVSLDMPKQRVRSGHDTLADAFGEEVYLEMKTGTIQDPETGHWASLGFEVKTGGFMIRKEGSNKSSEWLRIELVEGPAGPMDSPDFTSKLAQARWAKMKTAELLKRSCQRFYLPRQWNTSEKRPWITHEELRQKYQEYLEEKEKVQWTQDSDVT